MTLQIGNIVSPKSAADPLRSGGEYYPDAVVVSVDPFVLVSRETDMMWSATVKPERFEVVGQASADMLEHCKKRIG